MTIKSSGPFSTTSPQDEAKPYTKAPLDRGGLRERARSGQSSEDEQGSAEIRLRVGMRLRQLRKRGGMTQTELGIRAGGIRAGEISRFENGERLPSIETMARLSRGLGVPLRDLASFHEDSDPHGAEIEALAARLHGQSPRMVRMAIAVIDALLKNT